MPPAAASSTRARRRGGRTPAGTGASGWRLASASAPDSSGRSASEPSFSSSAGPYDAATTAPTPAMATRPATRAIALFTPEATPALCSSASASTVAVSGATVIDSPSENTSSAGRRSVT